MGETKVCKRHPDRPAFISESGHNMGLCHECIVETRRKTGRERSAKFRGELRPERAAILEARRNERNERSQRWREERKAEAAQTNPGPASPAPPNPKPETLKVFCMRCGFPMEFNPGGLAK